ncbi:MAG: hypothetical protein U0572_08210 [Phycisphaerales bacterium]
MSVSWNWTLKTSCPALPLAEIGGCGGRESEALGAFGVGFDAALGFGGAEGFDVADGFEAALGAALGLDACEVDEWFCAMAVHAKASGKMYITLGSRVGNAVRTERWSSRMCMVPRKTPTK